MTITNEDNMQLMSRYKDNYFDLAIVDPPYGISNNMKGSRPMGKQLSNKNWNDKNKDKIKFRNDYVASWGGRPQSNNNLLRINIDLFA